MLAACLLSGCGQSSSNSNDPSKSAPASASASAPPASAPITSASAPAVPPVEAVTPAVAAPVGAADGASVAAQASTEPVAEFAAVAAKQPDKTAASIGNDLAAKANSLVQSAQASPELKTQVASALQSLSAGKDATGLTKLFEQAKQANLTPQQTELAKNVGNLASAYVVQRNFSSLDGAQGDVATVVNSLRNGSITPALPALKSLSQNASLTAPQKDLLGTLADQYAPGLKKASDSLKQGLQGISGFGK